MCGIAGYILAEPATDTGLTLRTLLDSIRDRGPDDEGVCLISRHDRRLEKCRTKRTVTSLTADLAHFESTSGRFPHDVALINTRYAIIDRTDGGHQPFVSGDGSVVLSYNGEIYNFPELRRELETSGVRFRTRCDTEVLAEGFRVWGEAVWARLNGFWAAVVYDTTTSAVTLSRDRFGVAPLYYRVTDRGLFFASGLYPLACLPGTRPVPDSETLEGFIETSLKDFGERTAFREVRSVPPAVAVRIPDGATDPAGAERSRFWHFPGQAWSEGEVSFAEAVDEFRDLLFDAVRIRLRADVDVAFELSGGLDSSSIVAAAALETPGVSTFTLRVPEWDEEPYARSLLSRYSLDYRVLEDAEQRFAKKARGFARIMEEPYHAPNVYTHYVLRRAMKKDGFDVALAGSGGDELLGGYEFDFWPAARRELAAQGRSLDVLRGGMSFRFGTMGRARQTMREYRHRARLRLREVSGLRERPGRGDANEVPPSSSEAVRHQTRFPGLSFQERRLYHFTVGRLPYYLRSDDRYSMSIPVEHRLPFLAYRLVDFCLRLPVSYLYRNGWTKYVMRKAMEPYLPQRVVWRREKMGFPFALPPFLERHAQRFEPLVAEVRRAGLIGEGEPGYAFQLRHSPYRLWRICSTGYWLRWLDES
jgi:asparagine synthase (glutamine-hydrolysing)